MWLGIWSKVLIVALAGLIAAFGNLSLLGRIGTAMVGLIVVVYLSYRDHRGFKSEFVRGNLLYLVPGHLLLLFGLTTSKGYRSYWWWAWLLLIVATIAFDWIANSSLSFAVKKRAIMLLYILIWSDVFVLLHRWIIWGGKLDETGQFTFSLGLSIFGLAYIGMAVYRFTKLRPMKE